MAFSGRQVLASCSTATGRFFTRQAFSPSMAAEPRRSKEADAHAHGARLHLLGPVTFEAEGKSWPFTNERPFQLLLFLAVQGDWVLRDRAASRARARPRRRCSSSRP